MCVLVQLLYFPGCPHVEAARRVLREALAGLDESPVVEQVDVTASGTAAGLRGWGSPAIPGTPSLTVLRAALSASR